MAYVIPTDKGYYVITDDKRYTLAVAYTEQEQEVLYLKMQVARDRYKQDLAGLDFVCEEERDINDAIKERRLYYAHPGMYRFVPESEANPRYKELRKQLEAAQ